MYRKTWIIAATTVATAAAAVVAGAQAQVQASDAQRLPAAAVDDLVRRLQWEAAIARAMRSDPEAGPVVALAEAARIMREQFEAGHLSRADFEAAQRTILRTDSAIVARATGLYAARAITRSAFNKEVGLLRADSIIRAREDSLARAQRARTDTTASPSAAVLRDTRSSIVYGQPTGEPARSVGYLGGWPGSGWVGAETVFRAKLDWNQTIPGYPKFEGVWNASSTALPSASIGVGLRCDDCNMEKATDGRLTWTFHTVPVIGAVEAGSIADRLGLRAGDTLRTIDDVSLTTRAGGERMGAITPGKTIKLGWSRAGVTHTASVMIDSRMLSRADTDALRLSETIGNARVEVHGRGAAWTRDPRGGALRVTGDSITVIVHPPPAGKDSARRITPGDSY